jgi:hypothetical protein
MPFHFIRILSARWRFAGYKPRALTIFGLAKWFFQFPASHRSSLVPFLKYVRFVSEKNVRKTLVELNDRLVRRLEEGGIDRRHIIYVQMHDPGSSSTVILNMLRDAAQLQKVGSRLLDWQNVKHLSEVTNSLEQGAIVYVDDFAGSGAQFCEVRDFVSQQIVGLTFAEFALMPCVCEEARDKMQERGVECLAGTVHMKTDRPLHPESSLLKEKEKAQLIELSNMVDPRYGLGFRHLATMVILYSNCPDTVPSVLRGSEGQTPYSGIFPRPTDL